jgi:hypothetical protein
MQIGCKLYGWRFIRSSGERFEVERRLLSEGADLGMSLIKILDKICVVAFHVISKNVFGGEARID